VDGGCGNGGGAALSHTLVAPAPQVVLAYGAESDRPLGVPGEDAHGVFAAREFVWWYNAHPDARQLPVDLSRVKTAAVCGIGNVALDCARVLLRPPAQLAVTDIAEHALQQLRATSSVRAVHLFARRGPVQVCAPPAGRLAAGAEKSCSGRLSLVPVQRSCALPVSAAAGAGSRFTLASCSGRRPNLPAAAQAACTPKELRELVGLSNVAVHAPEEQMRVSPADVAEMKAVRMRRRMYDLITQVWPWGKGSVGCLCTLMPWPLLQSPEELGWQRRQGSSPGRRPMSCCLGYVRLPSLIPYVVWPPTPAGCHAAAAQR
jgi:hypothetical protein